MERRDFLKAAAATATAALLPGLGAAIVPNDARRVRVYQVSDGDWIAARSPEEAIEFAERLFREGQRSGHWRVTGEEIWATPRLIDDVDMVRWIYLDDRRPDIWTLADALAEKLQSGQVAPFHFGTNEDN